MSISAQGNALESFEASGLSIEEAERLASAFKPSWEFDEAPFTAGRGMDAAEMDHLAAGGVNGDVRGRDSQRSQSAPPHAPPPRVETHEPEVSVIIDRSITANELAGHPAQPASPPVPVAHAVPAAMGGMPPSSRMVPPASSRRPLVRPDASESIEIPAAFKKSNKGLFIGVGAAMAAALLVFVVRAATSDVDTPAGTPGSAAATSTSTAASPARAPESNIPPPPPMPTAATPPPAAAAPPPSPAPARAAPPAARPRAAPAAPAPARPRPTPKGPAKPGGGGIVRDVPF